MLMVSVLTFFYIKNLFACTNKYCEICKNHTLCKYEFPGPNSKCIGYEESSSLSQENVNTIVNQINKRRNYIASGHSKFFPAAANMRKIVWSDELSVFAQRWVDQCDQSLRPDKEDQCRDMERTKVSQSIATIIGSSPGVSIKSFVEMWFMQSLNYVGSVTYYNRSKDFKTNYFTQLIWADTDQVGCGKARFYKSEDYWLLENVQGETQAPTKTHHNPLYDNRIVKNSKSTLVERLVCNFAPGGNVHGKPVYTIGYAATQCHDDNMVPDKIYPGLCTYNLSAETLPSVNPEATSLLRIRNLLNDSTEQEIDPVYHNLKQIPRDSTAIRTPSETTLNFVDNSYDAIKRSYPLQNENFWLKSNNDTRHLDDSFHQQEKGHSRVYHNHGHRNEFDSLHPEANIPVSRKNNVYPTVMPIFYNDYNYRRYNTKHQCTRTINSQKVYSVTECNCNSKFAKCTRGQKSKCQNEKVTRKYMNDPCACNEFSTSCPGINRCNHNKNCDCVGVDYPTKCCPSMLKALDNTDSDDIEKNNDFHYPGFSDTRDVIDEPMKRRIGKKQIMKIPLSNSANSRRLIRQKVKNHNYSDMKRSVTEDEAAFKPFWQIDGFANTNRPQVKSIRYTTLSNKKRVLQSRNPGKSTKISYKTEIITIKNNKQQIHNNRFTEKYLSFDELLHLRKNKSNTNNGRRYDEGNNHNDKDEEKSLLREGTTISSTMEYTANTPFVRVKHCTRKLTCTWTAASLTDSAGSIIPGANANANMGSRTPPGYVEGCTRTSTCTRDFMNRNKMATFPIETTVPEMETDDEDYCERRSLNRRNSDNNSSDQFWHHHSSLIMKRKLYVGDKSYVTKRLKSKLIKSTRMKRDHFRNRSNFSSFINYGTIKRTIKKREYENEDENVLSYGDLYYLVLNKILDIWKKKNISHQYGKCLCNSISQIKCTKFLIFIVLLFTNFE